ncbi:MAG TPA: 4a-hydroxytetrahydrobiopterin dehydratase [Acidimicrobiales bacterium]|nr:4a-hydroxytetrahydrobiopterin dehydratase [Acidimicrobiales bacterium]
MAKRITPRQFHDAPGVEKWRVLANEVCTRFRTGSFSKGVEFVRVISELAEAANHHPDVDVRYSSVTVRMMTHDVDGLSQRDVELAQQISAAARALKPSADPAGVQDVQVSIDALAIPAVRAFWRAVLGYREEGNEDLLDPHSRGPSFWFQKMDEPREKRNRMHVDIYVPHDQAEARVAAAIAAGGRLVTDLYAPAWWVLADVEGNEACVASGMGRD